MPSANISPDVSRISFSVIFLLIALLSLSVPASGAMDMLLRFSIMPKSSALLVLALNDVIEKSTPFIAKTSLAYG